MVSKIYRSVFALILSVAVFSVQAAPGAGKHPIVSRDASTSTTNSHALIEAGLKALGGKNALNKIAGVTYESANIYRSQSLMQSYNMLKADVYIAVEGSQNVSFAYLADELHQRIDRNFTRSEYWYFAEPAPKPLSFSLVVQDGNKSFASYVRGNNYVFAGGPTATAGYQDDGLVEFLTHEANAMSPKLLDMILKNKAYTSSEVELHPGVTLPAVHDSKLNLTVIFDRETHLPYIIRTYEDHYVYGPSTRDLQLSEYAEIDDVMFPQRFMTIYNDESVLEDLHVKSVKINPKFPPDFFSGEPEDGQGNHKAPAPIDAKEYSQSEIGEFYENMLWNGAYTGTYDAIVASNPAPGLPNLWHLTFPDAPDYENLVLDFADGVMVLDAPPHQSKLIIKWVRKNLGKPITRIWPTHHHHDHSGGVADFTALNATLVIPAVAREYWARAAPAAAVATYTAARPYVHHDGAMQIRLLWEAQAQHAVDWSYAVVAPACPAPGGPVVAFEADAWSPGTDATRFDANFARQWLRQAERDGLSRDAAVVASHGRNVKGGAPLRDLIDVSGYVYPDYDARSWKTGGDICLA